MVRGKETDSSGLRTNELDSVFILITKEIEEGRLRFTNTETTETAPYGLMGWLV